MQPLSATDAVGLAFTHTRRVLAGSRPRLGHFFKLALLAAFTQATFLSVSFTYPLQGAQFAGFGHARHGPRYSFAAGAGTGAMAMLGVGLVVMVGVALLLTFVYLYLFARARASLFDLVVFRQGRVREAWRREGRAAWRYFGLLLLAMALFWIAIAAVLGPFLVGFFKTAMIHAQGAAAMGAMPGAMLSKILTMVAIVWLFLPLWIAVDALLQDFILPGVALELRSGATAAPVRDAFARLGGLARRSPGQLLLFLILRTVVAFAIVIALGLVALVLLGGVTLGLYGIGRLLYSALWSGGLGAHTLFFAAVAAMAMLVILLYLLCVIAVYGVSGTFKTSYAAIFFSGYYPELAAALTGPPGDEEVVGAHLPTSLPPEVW